jgi:hypothetical protein
MTAVPFPAPMTSGSIGTPRRRGVRCFGSVSASAGCGAGTGAGGAAAAAGSGGVGAASVTAGGAAVSDTGLSPSLRLQS